MTVLCEWAQVQRAQLAERETTWFKQKAVPSRMIRDEECRRHGLGISKPDPDNLRQLHPCGPAVIESGGSAVGVVGQLLGGLEASTIGQELSDACCSEGVV